MVVSQSSCPKQLLSSLMGWPCLYNTYLQTYYLLNVQSYVSKLTQQTFLTTCATKFHLAHEPNLHRVLISPKVIPSVFQLEKEHVTRLRIHIPQCLLLKMRSCQ